jgi:outer membrane protein assembly factor BamD
MKKLLILAVILATALSGCSSGRARREMPIDQRMAIANDYYEAGNYRKAIDYYIDVVFERRSIHTPLAQFRLGESYFNMGRYDDAVFEYRELIRLFPEFDQINIAYFRIGEAMHRQSLSAHYSQEETQAAIEAFNIFLDRFPFDEKRDEAISYIQDAQYTLLEKKYLNGYIYYKLFDYSAALLYLDEVIEIGIRDEIDRKSRYYAARIHIERGDQEKAREMVDSLQEYYPDTRMTTRVTRLYNNSF